MTTEKLDRIDAAAEAAMQGDGDLMSDGQLHAWHMDGPAPDAVRELVGEARALARVREILLDDLTRVPRFVIRDALAACDGEGK